MSFVSVLKVRTQLNILKISKSKQALKEDVLHKGYLKVDEIVI
jgi:hypothetical protein